MKSCWKCARFLQKTLHSAGTLMLSFFSRTVWNVQRQSTNNERSWWWHSFRGHLQTLWYYYFGFVPYSYLKFYRFLRYFRLSRHSYVDKSSRAKTLLFLCHSIRRWCLSVMCGFSGPMLVMLMGIIFSPNAFPVLNCAENSILFLFPHVTTHIQILLSRVAIIVSTLLKNNLVEIQHTSAKSMGSSLYTFCTVVLRLKRAKIISY